MSISYSLHLSSKGHALTSTNKIAAVSKHNLRDYKSSNYDRDFIEVLSGSDSILEDVKNIYHEEFDQALKKYNSKQKRADRKIDDYLKHVSDSRSDVGAEIIMQVGDMDFWEEKSLEQKKKMSYIFRDQLRYLQNQLPEFKIASAVVHYDEKSPHMHIVGVPVASGYKKGMEKQVAKTKIFTKKSLSNLQDIMRKRVERGIAMNPDVFNGEELKEKEKGRNKDIPKESLNEFYSLKDKTADLSMKISQLENYKKQLSNDILKAKNDLEDLAADELGVQISISEAQNDVLSKKRELNALMDEIGNKNAEIEKIRLLKADLMSTISECYEKYAELKQKYQAKKDDLSALAADIKDLPAFIREYQDKFKRVTRDELSRIYKQNLFSDDDITSSTHKKKKSRSR